MFCEFRTVGVNPSRRENWGKEIKRIKTGERQKHRLERISITDKIMKPKDTAQQKCETWAAVRSWKPSHFYWLMQTFNSFQLIHSMWLTLSVSSDPVWDFTFTLSRACCPPGPHYNTPRAHTLNLMPIKGVFSSNHWLFHQTAFICLCWVTRLNPLLEQGGTGQHNHYFIYLTFI